MSAMGDAPPAIDEEPRHVAGSTWGQSDYEAFVLALQSGLTDGDAAAILGRSVGALRSRAAYLLPPVVQHSRKADDLSNLREQLMNGVDYPWLEIVRTNHRLRNLHLWTPESDGRLRTAWENGGPSLPDLADSAGVTEVALVTRMLRLGIADSTLVIAERLGCRPGGRIESRVRLARDKTAVMLWVLTITDKTGTLHVSLHHDDSDARETLSAFFPAVHEPIDYRSTHHWSIAQRVVGEGSVRRTETASFNPRATPDRAQTPA